MLRKVIKAHTGEKLSHSYMTKGFNIQWQLINLKVIVWSHPTLCRLPAKCATLPRVGGAKCDLDPFFLLLSPPQFEIWNLVHFSQFCPPGSQFLHRQHCSALHRFIWLRIKTSWGIFYRTLLSIILSISPSQAGLDLCLQSLFCKTIFFSCQLQKGFKISETFIFQSFPLRESICPGSSWPGCGWSWM